MSVLDRAALRSQPARRPTRDRLGALDRRLPSTSAPRADRRDPRQAGRGGSRRSGTTEHEPDPPRSTPRRSEAPSRRRRGRRGGRGRGAAREEAEPEEQEAGRSRSRSRRRRSPPAAEEETVEGVVELLPNGSGFVRVAFPEPSDDDVYISAAQVKRCELVSGDRVSGPRRAPRRSERFASLVRIDTINDRPADELADSTRFDDLPAAFPSEPFRFGSEDPTLVAIERLTPIGRGSRVTIVGRPRGPGRPRRSAGWPRRSPATRAPGVRGARRRPPRGDRRVERRRSRRPPRSASPRPRTPRTTSSSSSSTRPAGSRPGAPTPWS